MSAASLLRRLTRRLFLAGLAGSLAAQQDSQQPAPRAASRKGQTLPADVRHYVDAATEFPLSRLTDPAYRSLLPPAPCRAIAHRGGYLIYSSDRVGAMQVFRLDLKTGESRQLTEVEALDPETVSLMPDNRSVLLFDGAALKQVNINSQRDHALYRLPEGHTRGQGFAVSEDGQHALFIESDGKRQRLQLLHTARGSVTTVVESAEPLRFPLPRPGRAGILYQRGEEMLRVVGYDGTLDRALKLGEGRLGQAIWSGDGKTVFYLSRPREPGKAYTIRENTPDLGSDKLVAPTSQFASFARNADASMFVGASANKGAPYLLLLLRLTRRELTLCEHRASEGFNVAPRFAPSSQKIYFQSDRDGKAALYTIDVARFVEETEEEDK